uniref:Uncharacterized protein n=1 Tax=Bracon brevicornis TaxID=1563983 RepID=A0A6V7IV97_9HYME
MLPRSHQIWGNCNLYQEEANYLNDYYHHPHYPLNPPLSSGYGVLPTVKPTLPYVLWWRQQTAASGGIISASVHHQIQFSGNFNQVNQPRNQLLRRLPRCYYRQQRRRHFNIEDKNQVSRSYLAHSLDSHHQVSRGMETR